MQRIGTHFTEYRLLVGLMLILAGVLVACGDIRIADYQPASADERKIIALLVQYQDAKNNQDLERFLSLLHDDGVFGFQCERMVSKAVLRKELPGFWADIQAGDAAVFPMVHECINGEYYPICAFANPHIEIKDDNAVGSALFTKGVCRVPLYFSMSREADSWRITRTEWGDG